MNATGCDHPLVAEVQHCFNGHPPLGVNATVHRSPSAAAIELRFNGHPPLGVNATQLMEELVRQGLMFQWAPTLGGECYHEWDEF